MKKGGLIKSVRGPGGGYRISCDQKETQLYLIFELLGGPFVPMGCDLSGCKDKECFIGGMIDELTEALLRYLKSRTLNDLTTHFEGSIPVDIDILVTTPSRRGNKSGKK
jgi:Rrf2 family nitric oxide-sensitive transcriptional repressor